MTVVGSNSALVEGGWLKSGRRENDDETVRRADFVITNKASGLTTGRQADGTFMTPPSAVRAFFASRAQER